MCWRHQHKARCCASSIRVAYSGNDLLPPMTHNKNTTLTLAGCVRRPLVAERQTKSNCMQHFRSELFGDDQQPRSRHLALQGTRRIAQMSTVSHLCTLALAATYLCLMLPILKADSSGPTLQPWASLVGGVFKVRVSCFVGGAEQYSHRGYSVNIVHFVESRLTGLHIVLMFCTRYRSSSSRRLNDHGGNLLVPIHILTHQTHAKPSPPS